MSVKQRSFVTAGPSLRKCLNLLSSSGDIGTRKVSITLSMFVESWIWLMIVQYRISITAETKYYGRYIKETQNISNKLGHAYDILSRAHISFPQTFRLRDCARVRIWSDLWFQVKACWKFNIVAHWLIEEKIDGKEGRSNFKSRREIGIIF